MHLCIHCQHHATTPGGDHLCRHPEIAEPSPVTGEPTARFCENERADDGRRCGPDGQFFEPQPGQELDEAD